MEQKKKKKMTATWLAHSCINQRLAHTLHKRDLCVQKITGTKHMN